MIIADTGFFVALLNRNDSYHHRSIEAAKSLEEPLITTWPVLTEACHILLRRAGPQILEAFLKQVGNGAFAIFEIPQSRYKDIPRLVRKYKDLPMDLADASLVLLAEFLGHGRILSTDQRDFKTYKWKRRKPFENLLTD